MIQNNLNSGSNSFNPIRTLMIATIVALIVVLLIAVCSLLMVYTSLSMEFSNAVAIFVFYAGACITGILNGMTADKNGWSKGALSALLYYLLIFILGSILNGFFKFNLNVLFKLLSTCIIGSFGGILGINIKNN